MKETGLMFKAPLVRAILEGRKTQTRRIVKPAPETDQRSQPITTETGLVYARSMEKIDYPNLRRIRWESPVGQPGDRIYVRETWRGVVNIAPPGSYEYAVARYVPDQEHCRRVEYAATQEADGEPWRPAIHMPKWAARIWLEVTGVRVERLQDISESDAQAEGCSIECMTPTGDDSGSAIYGPGGFAALWGSTTGHPALPAKTNSKRYARVKHWLDTHPDTNGWDANPWVWVVDFKVLSTTGKPSQADG